MNDDLRAGMAEATRHTLAGRLAEATATIQRTLGNLTAPGVAATARPAALPPLPFPDVLRRSAGMCAAGTARPGDHVHRVWQRRSRMPGAPGRVRPVTSDRVPPPAGQFVDGVYTNAAGTRSYKLYIPSGYVGQTLPLVVMLHGCTQTATDFAVGTRMNVFAEGEIFLVVYPEQAAAANGSRCWNWFQTAEQQRGAGEPSLIAGITQQIMSAYHVDGSRVYVAGLARGAGGEPRRLVHRAAGPRAPPRDGEICPRAPPHAQKSRPVCYPDALGGRAPDDRPPPTAYDLSPGVGGSRRQQEHGLGQTRR